MLLSRPIRSETQPPITWNSRGKIEASVK